jgi:TP901 family phage tail tape measure protein
MIVGEAVVGAAAIEIYPLTTGFDTRLRDQTKSGLDQVGKDAEKAGETAGANLRKGVGKETGKLGDDLEQHGKAGGERLSQGLSKGVSGLSNILGNLGVPLSGFGGGLDKAGNKVDSLGTKSHGLTGALSTLGGATLLTATAGVLGFGAAGVVAAGKYETATATIASNANISVGAAKKISDAFLGTMGTTIFSAQQIAGAYGQVAGQLGAVVGHALNAGEASKVMASAMDLAEATGSELNATTASLAKTMQAYHLGVGEASGASDILFNTQRVTGLSTEALTQALTRVKGKLGDLAPSLGESAGLLSGLAKEGVTGRTSISALSGAFTTLVGGGKPAKEMAQQLGVSIFDSSGRFVGMKSVIEQLSPKLHGLTEESQLQATKALFGASANKQMLDIVLKGPQAFQEEAAQVSKAGAAKEAAAKQAHALGHEVDLLKATATDLAIKFGNILIPILTKLGRGLAESIGWLGKHKAATEALAAVITTILGAAIGAFVAEKATALIGATKNMISSFALLAARVTGTAGVVEGENAAMTASTEAAAGAIDAALIGTGIGAALVALGIAAYELQGHWDEVMVALEKATETAANFIIEALNKVKEVVEDTSSLGLIPLLQETGVINGPVVGNLGKLTGESGMSPAQEKKEAERARVEGTPLEGGSKSATQGGIMAYFMSKLHLTAAQAAGIIGNIEQESSTNPNAPGGGLFQDIGGRASSGKGSVLQQIEAAARELLGPEHGTLAALKKAKTPEEAARIFSQGFERPGKPELHNREEYARDAYTAHPQHEAALNKNTAAIEHHTQAITGTGVLAEPTKAASKKAGVGTHKTAAGEAYADPFANATGLTRGRTDQGVDFGFSGALGAIGAGTVARIIQDPGGFGTELVEKLSAGAHKGQYVYYGLETGATSNTHQGARVRAGQRIATGKGTGGIELGFASGPGGVPITPFGPGASHEHPTAGGEAFSKFLAQVGKGGSRLQIASAEFEKAAKAELAKQTADTKVGQSQLSKIVGAIHSGGVKELTAVVGGAHDKWLAQLEQRLHADHTSALDTLVKKLVAAHTEALAALNKALIKAAEAAKSKELHYQDTVNADIANNAVAAIADSTKVTLDRAAEAGKTGAELVAAQAQTNLDVVKEADDAAVGAAKLAADRAAGSGELAEAQAQQALANTENQAKINEAAAQRTLDLATASASQAQKAAQEAEKQKQETEAKKNETPPATVSSNPTTPAMFIINIDGTGLSSAELVQQLGWELKTGGLPVAH